MELNQTERGLAMELNQTECGIAMELNQTEYGLAIELNQTEYGHSPTTCTKVGHCNRLGHTVGQNLSTNVQSRLWDAAL
jgi:hypothetical protein